MEKQLRVQQYQASKIQQQKIEMCKKTTKDIKC